MSSAQGRSAPKGHGLKSPIIVREGGEIRPGGLDLVKKNLASIKAEVALGTNVDPSVVRQIEDGIAELEGLKRVST
ncbi:MAG TPA: hypothetical protein VGO43_12170 [Pyrinomonadaceae bacterium]|jgi:hypothetical protein|nr:hypothetical protein [Pyrinomonadaceae bacterium]